VQAAIFLVASFIFTYVFFIILKSGQVLQKYFFILVFIFYKTRVAVRENRINFVLKWYIFPEILIGCGSRTGCGLVQGELPEPVQMETISEILNKFVH
jgi:hypothetical protein